MAIKFESTNPSWLQQRTNITDLAVITIRQANVIGGNFIRARMGTDRVMAMPYFTIHVKSQLVSYENTSTKPSEMCTVCALKKKVLRTSAFKLRDTPDAMERYKSSAFF